jgi:hypothetical protein
LVNVTALTNEGAVATAIQKQVTAYLAATPKAAGLLVMSFFSGQLWVFIIMAFLRSSTRGNKLIQGPTGRTAVGLAWHGTVLVPIYLFKFHQYDFDYQRILEVVIPTIVTGLLIQLIIFAFFAGSGGHR